MFKVPKWISELQPHAIWYVIERVVIAGLIGAGGGEVLHVSPVYLVLVALGFVLLVRPLIGRKSPPKITLPDEPPMLFRTKGVGRGLTAADCWADVGSYDHLIYEATKLKEALEDIRELDRDNRRGIYPLSAGLVPDVSVHLDKLLYDFRALYAFHLSKIHALFISAESVTTLMGFPCDVKSLDALRALGEHLKRLEELKEKALETAWSRACMEIRGLAEPPDAKQATA